MLSVSESEFASILKGIDAMLDAEVFPLHEKYAHVLDDHRLRWAEDGRYSEETLSLMRQVRMASAAAGYYTLTLPPPIGSVDLGWEGMYLLWEHLFKRCGTRYFLGHHVLAHWTKGPNPLLLHLAPEVSSTYLPSLEAGETSMCFAMSEPDAGSDLWGMRTRARKVEGGWRVDGGKQWISNGAHADLAVLFAVTDPEMLRARRGGVGAFVVPTDSEGFEVSSVSPMFGHVGSNEAILHFTDLFIPDDHVLGDPAGGFRLGMEGVSLGRIYNCAKSVGLALWATELAAEHAKIRTAFGSKISQHQGIAFPLAECAVAIRSARLLSLDSARRLDDGGHARTELAMAKIAATESAQHAIDVAMQVFGAMGFTNEVGLSEAWQMVRAVSVADGSSEILRRQVARDLFRHGVRV